MLSKGPGIGEDGVDGTAGKRSEGKSRGQGNNNNNNNNRRLVTLAEHTSDHGRQTNARRKWKIRNTYYKIKHCSSSELSTG